MVTLFPDMEHFRSTPGNFRQATEKNRLYSVFFDFAVECGQSDFEQAGCFGLITFCIFQHTGDVATLHSRKFKTAGSGFIGLYVMCVLYIERQVGNIQPFTSQTIRLRSITLRNSRILPFQGCCSRASRKAGVISVTGRANRTEKSFHKGFLPKYVHHPPVHARAADESGIRKACRINLRGNVLR